VRYANELKVGIAIVLSIVVMIVGIRFFENLPIFSGAYELYAVFDEVSGLAEGNAVRMKGLQIGTVGPISLDLKRQKVEVLMHINKDIMIPKGSRARIGGVSALSNVYVEIIPGPPENPPLPPGSRVPAEEITDPLDILMEKTGPMVNRVDSALYFLKHTLEGTYQVLGQPQGDLRLMLRSLRHTVGLLEDMLQSEQKKVAALIENLQHASAEVRAFTETQTDSLGATLSAARRSFARLNQTLEEVRGLNEQLTLLVQRINQGEGTLGLLATDDGLYRNLDSLIVHLDQVVKDFHSQPKKYLKDLKLFSLF